MCHPLLQLRLLFWVDKRKKVVWLRKTIELGGQSVRRQAATAVKVAPKDKKCCVYLAGHRFHYLGISNWSSLIYGRSRS